MLIVVAKAVLFAVALFFSVLGLLALVRPDLPAVFRLPGADG
jgi:hypothetical protein